jgi:hypothetical protein
MALYQSKQVAARYQFPDFENGRDVVAISAEYVVRTGGITVADIVEMGQVVPNSVVVFGTIHITGTSIPVTATIEWGVLSSTYGSLVQSRTLSTPEYLQGGALTATGAFLTLNRAQTADNPVPTSSSDNALETRGWGIRVSGTGTIPAGTIIRAHLIVRSLIPGMA